MTWTSPHLKIHDDAGVRTLLLDRAERRNALDTPLAGALLQALRAADTDASVGCVLLAANGTVFSAGADLGEFKGERADPLAEQRRSDLFLELQLAFEELHVPVVAAVAGAAVGAGASLAIAADLTVMGESARLAYPEIVHGMVPSLMIAHLQRRTGRKPAFELLALGEPVGAAQALALGLANRVVPDAEVLPTATALARTLASRARAAMRETKQLFIDHAAGTLADALQAGRDASRRRHQRSSQA
ncbi:MAG TPA: enoyl-CoA hydratase/isomerase family protein [Ramlibacter sp.]|nr:enoyl-CoA hydratase/isomerase family protein [Ramlibacter sp.]